MSDRYCTDCGPLPDVELVPAINPECAEPHNENDHHCGCVCSDCVYEYWLLKR